MTEVQFDNKYKPANDLKLNLIFHYNGKKYWKMKAHSQLSPFERLNHVIKVKRVWQTFENKSEGKNTCDLRGRDRNIDQTYTGLQSTNPLPLRSEGLDLDANAWRLTLKTNFTFHVRTCLLIGWAILLFVLFYYSKK